MQRWKAGTLTLWMLSSVASCAWVFGFDELHDRDAGGDATTPPLPEPQPDGGVSARTRCVPVPPPPDIPTRTGGDSYQLAMTSIHYTVETDETLVRGDPFNLAHDHDLLGLNQDCVDTYVPDASSCRLRAAANATQAFELAARDYEDGIDNAGVGLWETIGQVVPLFVKAASVRNRAIEGRIGMLIGIGQVSSLVDDRAVVVDLRPASGLLSAGANGCVIHPSSEDGTGPIPREPSPDDEWCIDQRFVSDFVALQQADTAYITAGRLVAHFPSVALPFTGKTTPTAYLAVDDVWLTGRLLPADVDAATPDATAADRVAAGVRLVDGLLVSRWSAADLARQLGAATRSFRDAGRGSCDLDDAVRGSLRDSFCATLDLTLDPTAPADAPCDSISLVVNFDAYHVAATGPVVSVPSLADLCDPDASVRPFDCEE